APWAMALDPAVPAGIAVVVKKACTLGTAALAAGLLVCRYTAPPPPATRRVTPAISAALVLLVSLDNTATHLWAVVSFLSGSIDLATEAVDGSNALPDEERPVNQDGHGVQGVREEIDHRVTLDDHGVGHELRAQI